jgi:predicted XRE-type DNA-binding protein
MAGKSAERRVPVTRGTGNVFADLGFPDAAERQARLRLAYALNQELEARKISQADAAKLLGVTQPKVSALRRYKLEGLLRRTPDEPFDCARSGCRDRDSAKTALEEDRSHKRRCGLSIRMAVGASPTVTNSRPQRKEALHASV